MGKCAQCGNNYDQSFEVAMGGRTLIVDSFECVRWRPVWLEMRAVRPYDREMRGTMPNAALGQMS